MILPGLQRVGYGWMPLVSAASLFIGISASYFIAVRLGHVYPILPYVSDAGALRPESCVFGQMLNIASALLVLIAYLRYRQVQQYHDGPTYLTKGNCVSAIAGYFTAAGLSILANVPLTPDDRYSIQKYAHDVGSVVCFAGAIIYGFTQGWITYSTAADFGSRVMAFVRFTLSIVAMVFAVSHLGFGKISMAQFNGTFAERWHWNPHDEGYEYHIYSAASEYVLTMTLAILILTLYKELRTITPLDTEESQQTSGVKGYIAIPRDP